MTAEDYERRRFRRIRYVMRTWAEAHLTGVCIVPNLHGAQYSEPIGPCDSATRKGS
jgi:hypothetical protein